MVRIYGIKNCDTMKKAFAWYEERGIAYAFHDYKKQGVPLDKLLAWSQAVGWKTLVNTKGATFRKLPPARQTIAGEDEAIALMLEFPSLIKRPLVETGNGPLIVGFDPTLFESFAH